MKRIFLAAVLLSFCSVPSDAALVVATCGTPPVTYTAGQTRPITVDTNGKICV